MTAFGSCVLQDCTDPLQFAATVDVTSSECTVDNQIFHFFPGASESCSEFPRCFFPEFCRCFPAFSRRFPEFPGGFQDFSWSFPGVFPELSRNFREFPGGFPEFLSLMSHADDE